MDIALIRTFLEVAATGSFVNASERLFVTQSAVSLRVQRLEDALGKPLFTRSKAGAELTSAGREFERYALSLVKVWEEARQQVGVPEGYHKSLSVGGQYSLWPRLGFRWIDAMQAEMPTLNVRAELGMPERITRFLMEGVVQAALLYTPQLRPGLSARQVMSEELVLVASFETTLDGMAPHYVFVDWGPEFLHAHALALPDLTNPGLSMALGALAGEYIVNRRKAAYLPARYVKRHLEAGRLFLVPDAPVFPYPAWSVWRDDLDENVREVAERALMTTVEALGREKEVVLSELAEVSTGDIEILGAGEAGK